MSRATIPAPALPERFGAYLSRPGRAVICNRDERGGIHWTMTTIEALDALEDVRTMSGELLAVYRSKAAT